MCKCVWFLLLFGVSRAGRGGRANLAHEIGTMWAHWHSNLETAHILSILRGVVA